MSFRRAFPTPSKVDPRLAAVRGALALAQLGAGGHSGRKVRSLSQKLGHAWSAAEKRILGAVPGALTRLDALVQPSLARPFARTADACGSSQPSGLSDTYTSGGVQVGLDLSPGGSQMTIDTASGDVTFHFVYRTSSCPPFTPPSCPTADGSVDAQGSSQDSVVIQASKGGQLVASRTYTADTTKRAHGQTADDAKLDYVDVEFSTHTEINWDGSYYADTITRTTQINMRTEAYVPSESSVARTSPGGPATAVAAKSDSNDFAAQMSKLISAYRAVEQGWQAPNSCAQLTFDPASNAIMVNKGDSGHFGGRVLAKKDGAAAAKARWQMTQQQNGSFSPTSTSGPEPSFGYVVASHVDGKTLAATAYVTSTAGIAQDTWSEPIVVDNINTVTGTFTGHDEDQGSVLDWSGTATFQRADGGMEIAGAFVLASGEATVTASGTAIGTGCQQTGTQQLALSPSSVWGVEGEAKPYTYQIVAPFDYPGTIDVTWINCSDPNLDGTPSTVSIGPAAIQSGDIAGLNQISPDGFAYDGSFSGAGLDPGEMVRWTWSMKGSP
jgi:hypothetical protein